MNRQSVSRAIVFLSLSLGLLTVSQVSQAVEVNFESDPSLPIVNINVAIKGGSVLDGKGEYGLSNFMGEMMLRGTHRLTKRQIDLALDQMGAKLEVETRSEAIIFRGAVVKNQLSPFLDLLLDLLTHPAFPENEIAKLKTEVSSGILEELGRDQALASRKFAPFLFRGHPYGKPILGNLKDIKALSRKSIMRQYDQLFRDRHLLVVGSGDAQEDQIRAWAYTLADARSGGEDFPTLDTPDNAAARRFMIVDKPDRTQVQIVGGQIGIRMDDPSFFPLYLANHAFGGGSFQARLMTEIRVKKGWSYGAYSYFKHGRLPRLWQFYLFPASKDAPEALAKTLQMVEDLQKSGITESEFEFAKRSLINSSGFMFNTAKKRVENRLLERTLDLPEGFMASYAKRLDQVTLQQVNEAAKKFWQTRKLAVLVVGTSSKIKSALAQRLGISPDQIAVVPYTQD